MYSKQTKKYAVYAADAEAYDLDYLINLLNNLKNQYPDRELFFDNDFIKVFYEDLETDAEYIERLEKNIELFKRKRVEYDNAIIDAEEEINRIRKRKRK